MFVFDYSQNISSLEITYSYSAIIYMHEVAFYSFVLIHCVTFLIGYYYVNFLLISRKSYIHLKAIIVLIVINQENRCITNCTSFRSLQVGRICKVE